MSDCGDSSGKCGDKSDHQNDGQYKSHLNLLALSEPGHDWCHSHHHCSRDSQFPSQLDFGSNPDLYNSVLEPPTGAGDSGQLPTDANPNNPDVQVPTPTPTSPSGVGDLGQPPTDANPNTNPEVPAPTSTPAPVSGAPTETNGAWNPGEGVNWVSSQWGSGATAFPTEAQLSAFKGDGAQSVRMMMDWNQMFPDGPNGPINQNYANEFNNVLQEGNQLGLKMILTAANVSGTGISDANFTAGWTQLANQFANKGWYALEPINEPHNGDNAAQLEASAIQQIRNVNPNVYIILDGNNYDGAENPSVVQANWQGFSQFANGHNLVLGPHFYPNADHSGTNDQLPSDWQQQDSTAIQTAASLGQSLGLPVWIGETGGDLNNANSSTAGDTNNWMQVMTQELSQAKADGIDVSLFAVDMPESGFQYITYGQPGANGQPLYGGANELQTLLTSVDG